MEGLVKSGAFDEFDENRNKILNRESTIDEISFLKEPNSSW